MAGFQVLVVRTNMNTSWKAKDGRTGKLLVVVLVGAGLLLAVFAAVYITLTWGK